MQTSDNSIGWLRLVILHKPDVHSLGLAGSLVVTLQEISLLSLNITGSKMSKPGNLFGKAWIKIDNRLFYKSMITYCISSENSIVSKSFFKFFLWAGIPGVFGKRYIGQWITDITCSWLTGKWVPNHFPGNPCRYYTGSLQRSSLQQPRCKTLLMASLFWVSIPKQVHLYCIINKM